MIEKEYKHISLVEFENLKLFRNIQHGITQKVKNNGSDFNLSYSVTDDIESVNNNRIILANTFEVETHKLVFPIQKHTDNVQIVTKDNYHEKFDYTDALITSENNIAIAVMGADCVPILLFDSENYVVAAIHSGWKGTVAGILLKTVQKMMDYFGTKPERIFAGIGPSICSVNYEVGEEVYSQFIENFPNHRDIVTNYHEPQKANVNLWKANQTWLKVAGVKNENIEISNLCTYSNPNQFYSARYHKEGAGRFAAIIKLYG